MQEVPPLSQHPYRLAGYRLSVLFKVSVLVMISTSFPYLTKGPFSWNMQFSEWNFILVKRVKKSSTLHVFWGAPVFSCGDNGTVFRQERVCSWPNGWSIVFSITLVFYFCGSKLLPCLTKQDTNSTKMVVTKVKDVFTKATTLKEFKYGNSP